MVNYQVVVGALLLSGSSAQRILSLVAVAATAGVAAAGVAVIWQRGFTLLGHALEGQPAVARTGCRLDGTAGAELDGGFGDVGAGEFLFGFGAGAA